MNNMERKKKKKKKERNCLIFLLQGGAATEGKSGAQATHLICMAGLKVLMGKVVCTTGSPDRGRKPRDGVRWRSRCPETAWGRCLAHLWSLVPEHTSAEPVMAETQPDMSRLWSTYGTTDGCGTPTGPPSPPCSFRERECGKHRNRGGSLENPTRTRQRAAHLDP